MPIEIRELVIRARLNDENAPDTHTAAPIQMAKDEATPETVVLKLSETEIQRIVALCLHRIKEMNTEQRMR